MKNLDIKIVGCKKDENLVIPFMGDSLETISRKVLPPGGGYSACINEVPVPRDEWSTTIPTEESQVAFVPDFGDPGSIAAAIAFAGTAPAVGVTASYLTYAALTLAVGAGISIGAGYLIKELTPTPKRSSIESPSPTYSWDPHTTVQKGTVWPKIYGTFKSYGNLKGNYVLPDDDDNTKLVLYALIDYGYGPIKSFSDIRINEQPQTNFKNISVETRRGLLDQEPISFFEKIRTQHRPNILVSNDSGAQEYELQGDDFDDIEVILQFQLFYHHESGPADYISCDVKIEAKEEGGGWQTVVEPTITNIGTTPFWEKYNVADYITVNRGSKYTIRVTKTSSDLDLDRAKNTLVLDYVTEVSDDNDALEHPGKVLIGISGLLQEEFTELQDVSAVIEGLIVQQWDSEEEEWVLDQSDSPGYVALDILTQPIISGDGDETPYAIEEYEGFDPTKVNTDDLIDLVTYNNNLSPDGDGGTEKLVTFNGIFDSETTVWEALLNVCRIARCVPVYEGNKISFIIEKPSSRVGILSAGNILEGTFEEDFLQDTERVSEIEVTYNDVDKNYDRTVVSVPSSTIDNFANKLTMDAPGLVKRTEVWRLGRFHLRHNELLKRQITVKGDIDCLDYRIGSRFGVQCDIANWGQLAEGSRGSGRVLQFIPGDSYDVLKLDYNIEDALEYFGDSGTTYEIIIRLRNDTLSLKEIVDVDGDEITVSKFTGDVKPDEDDLWVAGVQNYVVKDFRLLKLKRNSDLTFNLDLIEYNDNLWDDDSSTPLVPNINETPPKSIRNIVRPPTLADIRNRIPTISTQPWNTNIPTLCNLEVTDNSPSAGYVSWSAADGESPILLVYQGTVYEINPGNTDKEWIYWNKDSNPTTFLSTNDQTDALGADIWAICYNESGTSDTAFGRKIIHGGFIEAGSMDVLFAKINYAIINTAHIVDLSVSTIKIKDNAVSVLSEGYNASEQTMDGSTGGAGQTTTIMSLAKTCSGGEMVIFFGYANNIQTPHHVKLYRDSTELFDSGNREPDYGYKTHWTFQLTDDPGAGSYNYYLKIVIPGTNPSIRNVKQRSIIILERLK